MRYRFKEGNTTTRRVTVYQPRTSASTTNDAHIDRLTVKNPTKLTLPADTRIGGEIAEGEIHLKSHKTCSNKPNHPYSESLGDVNKKRSSEIYP
ncbi:MAG: hypothetical protein O3B74_04750 [Proteobacteria bacterium]|nr:hypothetical protein [Pseudomonadota bacterium]MDA1310281.1 hypothetical protein [Pseudomonadota bacterium]